MRVEHVEDALRRRNRLLQVRVDTAQLLRRRIHQQQRRHERKKVALLHVAAGHLFASVDQGEGHPDPADQLHQRRQARQRRGHFHVRAEQPHRRPAESIRLVRLRAERLDDAVAGERFGAEMREDAQRFLTPPRGPPHALAQPDQRVDDQRRARQADDRQPRIEIEHPRREAEKRQRLPREIADRLRHHLLHLADVVVDARHQLAGRPLGEEARRLSQDVLVERVAQVHHDTLPDVREQVRRRVRADALEQVHADDSPRHEGEVFLGRQHAADDRLDEHGEAGRAGRIEQHAHEGERQAPAIRSCVAEETLERAHSVNRYLIRTQSATRPSRHVIFLPSS